MTYYNPAIYNYANLHREDQATVKVMYDIFKDLENMEDYYKCEQGTPLMVRIFSETAIEVLAEVEERIMSNITEFIVSAIDKYDHDVDEIDTTDYLFGMELNSNDPI